MKLTEWTEVKEEQDDCDHLAWEETGTEISGVLEEVFQSHDGAWYGKIKTEGKEKMTMFSLPTILRGKLQGLKEKEIKIVYNGQIKFNNGRKGKDFTVYVRGNESDRT